MQKTMAGLLALSVIGAGIGTTVAVGQATGPEAEDCLDLRKAKKRNKCLRRAAAAADEADAAPVVQPTVTPLVQRTAAAVAGALRVADSYPYPDAIKDSADPWSFVVRNCTSYVAWMLNRDNNSTRPPYAFHNKLGGSRWGHAYEWEARALAVGFEVNNRPAKGAIAHWNTSEVRNKDGTPSVGHVAYVERVNADGSVDISEYNYDHALAFGQRHLPTGAPRYIHFRAGVVQEPPGVPGGLTPGRTTGPGPEQAGLAVRLAWNAVSGASDYDLGLRDLASGRFIAERRVSGTSFTANLQAGGRYRWNVAACNRSGCSDYAPALHFTVAAAGQPAVVVTATPKPVVTPQPTVTPRPTVTPQPTVTPRPVVTATPTPRPTATATATPRPAVALPAVPGRLSPGNSRSPGVSLPLSSVTIQWQAVTGAAEYDFGIRDMTSGRLVADSQTTRTYYIARLEKGHTYRWNVRACNSAGCSAFTAPLYFTLQ